MKKEINICEYCNKETHDRYAEKGWVYIDQFGLGITDGRGEDRCAKAAKYNPDILAKKDFDWCCIDHFIRWMEKKDE